MSKFEEHVKKTRNFAMNEELKELYNKIVPPAAEMETMAREMDANVKKLSKVVEDFDVAMSTKANKQELLAVDNKFRNFVKKTKYKPFVETTELEAHDLKAEVNDVVEKMADLQKSVYIDI